MKLKNLLVLFSLAFLIFGCNKKDNNTNNQEDTLKYLTSKVPLTYDLSLDDLADIHLIEEPLQGNYSPTYDISIEDLMTLKIVKELRIDTFLSVSYDLPIEDLMQIDIPLIAKSNSIEPTYEMTLKGLLEFELTENQNIINKIYLTYDLSIDGLLQISLEEETAVKH
jgi:hypothetical protein